MHYVIYVKDCLIAYKKFKSKKALDKFVSGFKTDDDNCILFVATGVEEFFVHAD